MPCSYLFSGSCQNLKCNTNSGDCSLRLGKCIDLESELKNIIILAQIFTRCSSPLMFAMYWFYSLGI